MDDTQQLLQFINLQRVPFAIGILVVGLVLNRLALGFLDDLGERFGNQRLLFKKLSALLRFSVYVILFGITVSSVVAKKAKRLVVANMCIYTNNIIIFKVRTMAGSSELEK